MAQGMNDNLPPVRPRAPLDAPARAAGLARVAPLSFEAAGRVLSVDSRSEQHGHGSEPQSTPGEIDPALLTEARIERAVLRLQRAFDADTRALADEMEADASAVATESAAAPTPHRGIATYTTIRELL